MNNLNPYLILLNEFSMRKVIKDSGLNVAIQFHASSFPKYMSYLKTFFDYCGLKISNKKLKDLANGYFTGRISQSSVSPLYLGSLIQRGGRLTGGQMKYLEDVKSGLRKVIF